MSTTPKTNPGNFFEDFQIGQTIEHAVARTVNEGDNALYVALTGDRHPLYCNREFARRLGFRRELVNDLLVFHVLDPAEIEFPYDDASSFQDLESGEQIPVVPDTLAAQYRTLMQEHIAALGTRFSDHRIDYTPLNTSEPLDHALFSYLSNRERLMRVR